MSKAKVKKATAPRTCLQRGYAIRLDQPGASFTFDCLNASDAAHDTNCRHYERTEVLAPRKGRAGK